MTIKEIMTAPVSTTTPSETIRDAAKKLASGDVGILPVISDKNEPIGTLTDRDIVVRVVAEGKDASTRVDSAMSGNVVACATDTSIDEAARLMREHKVRRLMATQDGALVGVVSIGDVARRSEDPGMIAQTLETISS